ncbi:MAG: hypothetical protein HYZ20_13015 [Burkholderiales bacterium]|nr:hypothetical protein [Burkholderiales bacterium]
MAIGDPLGGTGSGDWASAVEHAVAAEFHRRRRVARGTLALLTLAAALVLATAAWHLQRVGAEATSSAERAAERAVERAGAAQIAPLAARDDELFANQVALARHQVDLGERLEQLEKEAAALAVSLDRLGLLDADSAGLPAQVLPAAIRALPSAQSRQQARIAALERRVRALERLRSETGEAAADAQRP